MKIGLYILSLYIAILSCMPCADIESDCGLNGKALIEQSHDDGHLDICSPFCSCSCCGNQMAFQIQPVIINPVSHFFVEKLQAQNYEPQFVSNFYGNIWQPPKISETT